jgi:hypothetical protein
MLFAVRAGREFRPNWITRVDWELYVEWAASVRKTQQFDSPDCERRAQALHWCRRNLLRFRDFRRNPLAAPHRTYEFRCPVHGFIQLNDWEKQIVSQPAFQRLRRIRQLGWTDYVYPGAMHTRFEHSLGVMHIATLLYDSVVKRSKSVLEEELAYNESGFERDRQLVRLAACFTM